MSTNLNSISKMHGRLAAVGQSMRITATALALAIALAIAGTCATGSSAWAKGAASNKEVKYTPKKSHYEKLAEPKKGGTLYYYLNSNPKVINPILSTDNTSMSMEPFFFATLFWEDEETLEPIPYLASGYTISADKKTYTFKLNEEARWSDGTAVTTDDVKFTFDTIMNPKTDSAPLRTYFEGTSLEVVDKLTFKFIVKEAKFDTFRSLFVFQTIQKKQYESDTDFNRAKGILNPVGNGPYELASFSRDQKIEVKRKKDWWGNKLPFTKPIWNFDQITFRIVTDINLIYEKWIKGDIDVMSFEGMGNSIYATRARGTDKDIVGTKPEDGKNVWASEFPNHSQRIYTYIGWNELNPLFQTVKTRTALSHLVDYKQISDKVFFGLQVQCTSPFSSLSRNSDQNLRKPGVMVTTDVKKAQKLLAEDGWKINNERHILTKNVNGKDVDFKFVLKTNSNNPARLKIAQIIKENFKQVGIEVEVRGVEWNTILDEMDKKEFDAVIMAWVPTPYPNPKQVWHTDAAKNQGSNFISYSNKKVDELIEKANQEMDPNKRPKIMQEINRLLYADQPYTFLLEPKALVIGFNKRVQPAIEGKKALWILDQNQTPPIGIYSVVP